MCIYFCFLPKPYWNNSFYKNKYKHIRVEKAREQTEVAEFWKLEIRWTSGKSPRNPQKNCILSQQ